MVRLRLEDIEFKQEGFELNIPFLEARPGEFLTLLGPSGCGKTTTLRIVAGFEKPDRGRIYFDDIVMNEVPPYERNIGIVFQDYALFPHMTVYDNISFGLRLRKLPKEEIKRRVSWALELVGLEGFENRYPEQLSGGQQQRVALARALVIEPQLLLLDEPLSNLDAKIRERLRGEIKRIQRELGITTIYVTHDQEEAMAISDRIAVMSIGKIEQVGEPDQFFSSPATPYVAEFFGVNNVFKARFEGDKALVGDVTITLKAPPKAREGFVVIRPDDIVISKIPVSSSA